MEKPDGRGEEVGEEEGQKEVEEKRRADHDVRVYVQA